MDTILFDLDGTLLPMDQSIFVKCYMGELAERFAPLGFDRQIFQEALVAATMAQVNNTSEHTNEEVFWQVFGGLTSPDIRKYEPAFRAYYATDYQQLSRLVRSGGKAGEAVALLRKKGYQLVLATNPLFPQAAVWPRIQWAGLCPEDFVWITTFENSRRCKPNPDYFRELLDKLGKNPADCMMVGNDVRDDIVPSSALGIRNYLITDFLIHRGCQDLSRWPHGSFEEFLTFAAGLPEAGKEEPAPSEEGRKTAC